MQASSAESFVFKGPADPALEKALVALPNICALLDARASGARAEKLAMATQSADGRWHELSWRQFRDASLVMAARLAACGVGRGTHVGVLIDGQANLEGQVAIYALARLGAVLVPLNPRYQADELAYGIAHADCAAVIASPPYVEKVEALAVRLPDMRLRFAFTGSAPKGWLVLEGMNASLPSAWPEVHRDDLLNIIFTSGTTARPKGVMHSHATALACGAIFATALGLTAEDSMHHATPFFTSSGSHIGPMMQLWSGEAVIIEAGFNPAAQLERLSRLRPTILGGVPAQLLFLLEERERRPDIDMSSVRLVDYGGSPTPVEIVRAIEKRFAPAGQVQQWGMTEIGIATLLPAEDTIRKIGSAGKTAVLCAIKIIDAEGKALPPGELGEICALSPANMLGYYKDPKATAETMKDGWVRTGDLGRIDADGYFFYSDRLKDTVNRGSLKISSIEVEEVLFQHPDVREAAVVGIPHPKLGEDVAAFVSAKEGHFIDPEALIAFTRDKLADYKCPRKIFVVDLLPRNGMGKVAKNELRARVKT